MPLPTPSLGNPDYRAILNEALARIPVHNPEWTNFNESDPGVTLLQLFSFMSENVLYRANLIPLRNRTKFLKLLGIPLQGATAAQGFVTFGNSRQPLRTRTLSADTEVLAGKVPFRTENGLDVLPLEAKVYYKKESSSVEDAGTQEIYEQLYASIETESQDFAFYETAEQETASDTETPTIDSTETVDDFIWVALLAPKGTEPDDVREVIAGQILSLGIIPIPDPATATLYPGGAPQEDQGATLVFRRPKVAYQNDGTAIDEYALLDSRPLDGVNPLLEPGIVELELPGQSEIGTWSDLDPLEGGTKGLPPFLEDESIEKRLVTWIQVGVSDRSKVGPNRFRVHVAGINAAMVTQRARVSGEFLGLGNGQPDQSFKLVNTPVIEDGVRLTVNGQLWARIDDIANAGAEVRRKTARSDLPTVSNTDSTDEKPVDVYTIDRESGELRFGDGLHGRRPAAGAVIQASYDYGGGIQGLVGVGAITKGTSLPAGLEVTNPIRTWGGAEAETVAEAEKNIPNFLRHRDRLVSVADFEEITLRTPGVDVGRVEILPRFDPDTGATDAEGMVTVMVVPKYDLLHPKTPQPDHLFLTSVCKYLHPRRLITTEVHIRGPEYVSIWVSIGIEVLSGMEFSPVREEVKRIMEQFLGSLTGGYAKDGWPMERSIESSELLAVAARVSGVSSVNEVLLGTDSGAAATIPLTGLQLPRLEAVEVQSDTAQSLEELRGEVSDAPESNRTPIPVIPDDC